jgi:ABC-type sugar transport system substrate-binding protein
MNTRGVVAAFAAAFVALALAPQQASAQQQKKIRVAFANFNDEHSFGSIVLRGMQAAAKQRPDIEMIYYDNKSDAAKSVENARAGAVVRPDVYINYNVNPATNPQIGRILKDAGIPVLSVQTRVPETPIFAVDNALSGYEACRALSEQAKKQWAGKPPVIFLLSYPEGGPLFLERTSACRKAIGEQLPGAAIQEQSTKNDTGHARAVTTDLFTRNANQKVMIWAHVDSMAIAALTAARNSNREADLLLSATGGEAAVFPEIRKQGGPYVGTFSFFPENWGVDILNLATKMARKEAVPEVTRPTRQVFVTRQNIDQLYPR